MLMATLARRVNNYKATFYSIGIVNYASNSIIYDCNNCKKRVVVQNKSNLLLKISLFYTQTLQLFTINKIKLNRKLFTRANLNF
jgi:hypothetical protein